MLTTLTAPAELAAYAAATLAAPAAHDSRQAHRSHHLVTYVAGQRASSDSRWSVLSESAARFQAAQSAGYGYTAEVWGPDGLLAVVLPAARPKRVRARRIAHAQAA